MNQPEQGPEAADRDAKMASEREWLRQIAETNNHEIAESKRFFEEGEAHAAKQREANKKKGAALRTFAEATEFARNQIKSDGLNGEVRPHYEIRYTVAQGLKAAIHGREDGIATLVIQRDILLRLDFINSLLWIVIALLGFIAYKVA
jgi:hypothetical protein